MNITSTDAPTPSPWLPAPPALHPSADTVDIWQISPNDISPAALDAFFALLTPEEQQKADRFRMPDKRRESIVARGLLRTVLAGVLQIPARQVPLTTGPQGKPCLDPTSPHAHIYFNTTHTFNRILVAVTVGHEIGIDIEHVRTNSDLEGLALRFFSPTEHAALLAIPQPQRVRAFFTCWTRKEALLKATGLGLFAGLNAFEVTLDPASPPAIRATADPAHAARWLLHDIHVTPAYAAALAAPRACRTIRHWLAPPHP